MQADEFEKKIKNKMEEFELVPGNVVWKEISIKIEQEKKKRKILFYVLFTSFLLLAGVSAWWFINNENTRQFAKNDTINNATKIENYEIKQNTKSLSRKLNKLNKLSIKNNAAPITKKFAYTNKVGLQKKVAAETKNKNSKETIYHKVIIKELITDRENDNKNVHNKENEIPKSLLPHRFYNPDLAIKKKIDTLIINSSNKSENFKKYAVINTTAKETIVTKNSKKWNIGFTVYSGFSSNRSGVPLLQKDYIQNFSTSPVYSNNGNYSYDVTTSNNFKKGFSFGFGIFAKKRLAKKINFSAGAYYHSYTAKLTVGNKVNQQRNFYDSVNEEAIVVSEYYSAESSAEYLNKYRFLQLPVNLEYQINKNQKKPFLISAGISPGFLISSNALHANPTARVYYVDKQQFNHLQLSAQIGFSFSLISSSKYLLSVGPSVQYSFTNASKAAADARQHLFFTGIKANIILK